MKSKEQYKELYLNVKEIEAKQLDGIDYFLHEINRLNMEVLGSQWDFTDAFIVSEAVENFNKDILRCVKK